MRGELDEKKKEIARSTDLVNLVTHLGYHPIKKGNYFSLEEMSSVMIFNRRTFTRFSTMHSSERQSGDAISWLMKLQGMEFQEAVNYLVDFNGYGYLNETNYREIEIKPVTIQKVEKKSFVLPPIARYQTWMFEYLMGRGISRETIKMFYDKKMIYLSDKRYNVVFVSYDPNGVAKHAYQRGIRSDFKGDVEGNDKDYGFNLFRKESDTVVVSEAAIDIMSYYDVTQDKTSSLLALGMISDGPLVRYLGDHPNIKHIKLLLDSDKKGCEATISLLAKYQSEEWKKQGITVEDIRYGGMTSIGCKDANELLCYMRKNPGQIQNPYPYPFLNGTSQKQDIVQMKSTEKELPKASVLLPESKVSTVTDLVNIKELLLEEFRENYKYMLQVNAQSREGQISDMEVYQAVGAARALFTICEKVGLQSYLSDITQKGLEQPQSIPPPGRKCNR